MVATFPSVGMRVVSGPYFKRRGLVPLLIGLTLGWIFVCIWAAVAVFLLSNNWAWSFALFASTFGFAGFLCSLTYQVFCDAFKTYTFELTDAEAVLLIFDRLRKKKRVQMVLLDDVKFAEYYPYLDDSSVIFHAPYADMEVPLWPMGLHAQDILDFLKGRGVRVINVESDEKFPD
ncbi:MAG: hypothetical protein U0103_18400 [Candidatus Obscuribacterales bacterium]